MKPACKLQNFVRGFKYRNNRGLVSKQRITNMLIILAQKCRLFNCTLLSHKLKEVVLVIKSKKQ